MTDDNTLRLENAEITEVLPNTTFSVTLANGAKMICHLSGKMRKNNIRVSKGDRVDIELSTYDYSKGRIVYRHK
jgi:translation initiation factor IF-1